MKRQVPMFTSMFQKLLIVKLPPNLKLKRKIQKLFNFVGVPQFKLLLQKNKNQKKIPTN